MKYKVIAKQVFEWEYEVDADTKNDAEEKAREYFAEANDGVTGVCDIYSVAGETKFKVIKQ